MRTANRGVMSSWAPDWRAVACGMFFNEELMMIVPANDSAGVRW